MAWLETETANQANVVEPRQSVNEGEREIVLLKWGFQKFITWNWEHSFSIERKYGTASKCSWRCIFYRWSWQVVHPLLLPYPSPPITGGRVTVHFNTSGVGRNTASVMCGWRIKHERAQIFPDLVSHLCSAASF